MPESSETGADFMQQSGQDNTHLQRMIQAAIRKQMPLACFIYTDNDPVSESWIEVLYSDNMQQQLQKTSLAVGLQAGSEQAGFLGALVPIESTPALIMIENAQATLNLQSATTTPAELKEKLEQWCLNVYRSRPASQLTPTGEKLYIDLPPSTGRMRLPNNAYDHFRKITSQQLASGVGGELLLRVQLRILELANIDIVNTNVRILREQVETVVNPKLTDAVQEKLLNTPASAIYPPEERPTPTRTQQPTTAGQSPPAPQPGARPIPPTQASSSATRSSAPAGPQPASRPSVPTKESRPKPSRSETASSNDDSTSKSAKPITLSEPPQPKLRPTAIRIQVRTFTGSLIRTTLQPNSTITGDLRPWIDSSVDADTKKPVTENKPYDLKLILTPLPNRTIETSEESRTLEDVEGVGGTGSCTFVMVPVKGFVESYVGASGSGGIIGSVVSSGAGVVTGVLGGVWGGVNRLLGSGPTAQPTEASDARPAQGRTAGGDTRTGGNSVRVRTLGDQRAEDAERRKDQQLYNGNQLNFEPRKDDD